MIALYYWYIDIPTQSLDEQVNFHESLCNELKLKGRIRLSSEGLNGVLSGQKRDLEEYAERMRDEVESKFRRDVNCCGGNDSSIGMGSGSIGSGGGQKGDGPPLKYGQTLDVKYCHLRPTLEEEKQLFDSLSVKVTTEVVSLNETTSTNTVTDEMSVENRNKDKKKKKKKKKKNKGDRYEQIMEAHYQQQEQQQKQQVTEEKIPSLEQDAMLDLDKFQPATHLSPKEWNDHLLSYKNDNTNGDKDHESAILIDARNIYESKIGYFSSDNVPTLLTNTRKYSTITSVFNKSMEHLSGKKIYMYCTGGVRCERASVYLQALANSDAWPSGLEKPKSIYQLEGGIQKYLEEFGELEKLSSLNGDQCDNANDDLEWDVKKRIKTKCLFRGKNFVFDPRRYDPVVGNVDQPVGRCIICSIPFDDYDNTHAPCENKEARCCRCRVLILVCNSCRCNVRVWGEGGGGDVVGRVQHELKDGEECDGGGEKVVPDVYCGLQGKECINEGNDVNHYEIINNDTT